MRMFIKQGKDDVRATIRVEVHKHLSPAVTEEVLLRHEMLDKTPA